MLQCILEKLLPTHADIYLFDVLHSGRCVVAHVVEGLEATLLVFCCLLNVDY